MRAKVIEARFPKWVYTCVFVWLFDKWDRFLNSFQLSGTQTAQMLITRSAAHTTARALLSTHFPWGVCLRYMCAACYGKCCGVFFFVEVCVGGMFVLRINMFLPFTCHGFWWYPEGISKLVCTCTSVCWGVEFHLGEFCAFQKHTRTVCGLLPLKDEYRNPWLILEGKICWGTRNWNIITCTTSCNNTILTYLKCLCFSVALATCLCF